MDRDVESFLALLAARRAPRTVEAYRRDLETLRAYLGKPVGDSTREDI
jgi:site-specific recombinase XerD